MSKRKQVRPGRVFADPFEIAVAVEYLVETYNRGTGEIQSKRKQAKIRLNELGCDIDQNVDTHEVAENVVKRCKYIPEKWTAEVESVVQQLVLRQSGDEGVVDADNGSNESGSDDIAGMVDRCLELLYGGVGDKSEGLEDVLALCRDAGNLEYLIQNHHLMSALSRTLAEDSTTSSSIRFNIGRVFLAFSNFVEMHHILSNYRVGALLMDAINLEIKRAHLRKENVGELHCGSAKRQDKVVCIFLHALNNLADDVDVQRKMLKKDLLGILCNSLDRKSSLCLHSTLELLGKTSIFEESAIELSGANNTTIRKLMCLIGCGDDKIVKSTLLVLFNLSFNRRCRTVMMGQECFFLKLSCLLKTPWHRKTTLKLLYHLSVDQCCKKHLEDANLSAILLQLILKYPGTRIGKELAALAVNASLNPCCAEIMAKDLDNLMMRLTEHGDVVVAKVIRNISIWTNSHAMDTNDPGRFWEKHTVGMLRMAQASKENELLVELLGILGNITPHDLHEGQMWSDLMSQFALTTFLEKHFLGQDDIKLEALVLCGQMCANQDSASLLVSSNVVNCVHQLWDDSDDSEFALQILCVYRHFLCFETTRKAILSRLDIIEHILQCSGSESHEVRCVADICLEIIREFDRGANGSLGEIGYLILSHQFYRHNGDWGGSSDSRGNQTGPADLLAQD